MHPVRTRKASGQLANTRAAVDAAIIAISDESPPAQAAERATKPPRAKARSGARKAARSATAFPVDVVVPPHRGAISTPGPLAVPLTAAPERADLIVGKPKRPAARGRAAPAPVIDRHAGEPVGAAPRAKAKPPRAPRQQPARKDPGKAKAAPAAILLPPPAPQGAEPKHAAGDPAALASAALPRPPVWVPEPSRQRALVPVRHGLVAQVVSWLSGFLPRKSRAALPKARTRVVRTQIAPLAPATPPDGGADLRARMLLQLSQENERLRRENEALRATLEARTQS